MFCTNPFNKDPIRAQFKIRVGRYHPRYSIHCNVMFWYNRQYFVLLFNSFQAYRLKCFCGYGPRPWNETLTNKITQSQRLNDSHVSHKLLVMSNSSSHTQRSWEWRLPDCPIACHGVGAENCVSPTEGTTSYVFFVVTN